MKQLLERLARSCLWYYFAKILPLAVSPKLIAAIKFECGLQRCNSSNRNIRTLVYVELSGSCSVQSPIMFVEEQDFELRSSNEPVFVLTAFKLITSTCVTKVNVQLTMSIKPMITKHG
ncbi:hypothetical protein V6N13_028296 [Hibiscus sabdariffa]|uniref:Secreted protein n=1 Tax=Hibiscus sabdariffa TaxID=183260 RepID=A0ABR2DAV1_9ROSI